MELGTPDISRPLDRALTTLDALGLTETPPDSAGGGSKGGDGGN